MKPIVILSATIDPDYLFCLPITAKTWELQGWEPCIGIESWKHIESVYKRLNFGEYDPYDHQQFKELSHLSSVTISQVIRLYQACNLLPGRENIPVCIGDVDMLIGSNFLYRDFHSINVYGHDLTGFEHIPMCYVVMTNGDWRKVMQFRGDYGSLIKEDIDKYGNLSTDHGRWVLDQDILTAKLKAYGYDKINFINRGTDPDNHNLPIGRWDRYGGMKRPKGQVHDVHLMRKPYEQQNTEKIIEICKDLYPAEDWSWIQEYRNEFVKEMSL